MRLLLLAALLALPACARLASSPLNPLTWFGGSTEVVGGTAQPATLRPLVSQDQLALVVDRRVPIERIDALQIERMPSGAIVRATGTAAAQGHYNAELVPIATSGGTLVYEFRVETPPGAQPQSAVPTQRITVATELDADQLAAIRTVRVQGRTNAREASR